MDQIRIPDRTIAKEKQEQVRESGKTERQTVWIDDRRPSQFAMKQLTDCMTNSVMQRKTKIIFGHRNFTYPIIGEDDNVTTASETVGCHMDAILDPTDPVVGSQTDSVEQAGLMDSFKESKKKKSPNYVSSAMIKGHLLNHDLGGYAVPANLFPITMAANHNHQQAVEEPVELALYHASLAKNGTCVHYEVAVDSKFCGPYNSEDTDTFKCKAEFVKNDGQKELILAADIPSVPQAGGAKNMSKEQREQYATNVASGKAVKRQWVGDAGIPTKKKNKGQPLYVLDNWYHRVKMEGTSKLYERKGLENLDKESHITSVNMNTGLVDSQASLGMILPMVGEIIGGRSKENLPDSLFLCALRKEIKAVLSDDNIVGLIMNYADKFPYLFKEYFSIPQLAFAILSNSDFEVFERYAGGTYESQLSQIRELLVLMPDIYPYIPPEYIWSVLRQEVYAHSAIWGSGVMMNLQDVDISNFNSYQDLLQRIMKEGDMSSEEFMARMNADVQCFLEEASRYEQFINGSPQACELFVEAQGFLPKAWFAGQQELSLEELSLEELFEWREFWWDLRQEWDDLIEESTSEDPFGGRWNVILARRLPECISASELRFYMNDRQQPNLQSYVECILNNPQVSSILCLDLKKQIEGIIPERLHDDLWENAIFPNLLGIIMESEDYEMVCSKYISCARDCVMESPELWPEIYITWFESEMKYLQTKLPDGILVNKDQVLAETAEFAIPVIISELSCQEVRDSVILLYMKHPLYRQFIHGDLSTVLPDNILSCMNMDELMQNFELLLLGRGRSYKEILDWYIAEKRLDVANNAGEVPGVTDPQKMEESCKNIAEIIAPKGMEANTCLQILSQKYNISDFPVLYRKVMELAAPLFLPKSPDISQ